MKLLLSLSLVLFPLVGVAAPPVKASWDYSPEPEVGGYMLLYGSTSQSYTATNYVTGRLNNTALVNLPVGVSYIVVQAYSTNGVVSPYSYEVMWTNAPAAPLPPKNLQLKATIQSASSPKGPWTDVAWVKTVGASTNVFRTVLVKEEELP